MFLCLLLVAAVYAQAPGAEVPVDWTKILRDAGPAAALVCYFLWRVERTLSHGFRELAHVGDHGFRIRNRDRDGRDVA